MEVLAYLEVLLRNAIDRELTKFADESRRGLPPWFMLPSVNGPSHNEITTAVETTRGRLRGISRAGMRGARSSRGYRLASGRRSLKRPMRTCGAAR